MAVCEISINLPASEANENASQLEVDARFLVKSTVLSLLLHRLTEKDFWEATRMF
jgi:hypothetical protein